MATSKVMVTVTPLQKHHGQHGGLIALGLLVAASAVVWATHPREPDPTLAADKPVAAPTAASTTADTST